MQPLDQIRAIAERVASARGLDVWDIQSRRETGGHVIRVFIDRPGPSATPEESVSIDDCAEVNRELSIILDVEDPLPFAYTLEVSSPGLTRPLRGLEDYARFAGRYAKVVVREAVDNQKAFEGHLRGVAREPAGPGAGTAEPVSSAGADSTAPDAAGSGEDVVLLAAPNGRVHRLPFRLITRGRLEVEF